uniref:Uncharacterized protein n=1 Tax=Anopheles arabiensis TaxID=7173 RepID=A0A182IFK1_ANOAR
MRVCRSECVKVRAARVFAVPQQIGYRIELSVRKSGRTQRETRTCTIRSPRTHPLPSLAPSTPGSR